MIATASAMCLSAVRVDAFARRRSRRRLLRSSDLLDQGRALRALHLLELLRLDPVAVLGRGEGELLDVGAEGAERDDRLVGEVLVALHEARQAPAREAEQVVEHEHLAVAEGAGADADRGDR